MRLPFQTREVPLVVRFGAFTLDARARQLLRGTELVHLSPKAFDLLALLIEERNGALSKSDIHRRLWPDTFVSDGSLAVLVKEIRDALGDDAHRPAFVRTVHRFGYAFVAAAAEADTMTRGRVWPQCWLAWGTERAALKPGDNVIGRDPGADICIDAIGVSRRHAIITVAEDGITLQDLASKNGTFVDDVRVASPVALQDRARIRLGPLAVQFRLAREVEPTSTMDSVQHPGGFR